MDKFIYFIMLLLVVSCNIIYSGDDLSSNELKHIQSLGLLDSGENVHAFYSQNGKELAGNFFSDKRLAAYWIDMNHPDRTHFDYAFYRDIIALDTVYYVGAISAPYIKVWRKDSSNFKVYFKDEKSKMKTTFESAFEEWKLKKNQ